MNGPEFRLEDYCIQWDNRTVYPTGQTSAKCHLVVGLFYSEVDRFTIAGIEHVFVCSNHNEVTKLFLRYLGCSLDFVLSSFSFGGFKVGDGWTGALSLLHQNRADVIPHYFAAHSNREEIVHYDFLVPQKELMTVLSYPKEATFQSPLKLFHCFSLLVWLLIGAFFILYGLINYRRSTRFSKGGLWSNNLYNILLNFMEMFALLVGQGTVPLTSRINNLFHNPLYLVIFAFFVLRQFFSGDITAVLLSMGHEVVDRFEQLITMSRDLEIICEEKSSTYYNFVQKFPSLQKQVVIETFDNIDSVHVLQRLISSSAVLIVARARAELIKNHHSNLEFHVSQEGFFLAMGNFAIRRTLDKNLRLRLAKLFKHLYYFGLVDVIDKKMFYLPFHAARKPNQTLEAFRASFLEHQSDSLSPGNDPNFHPGKQVAVVLIYIYSVGICLALGALFVEIGVFRMKTQGHGYFICRSGSSIFSRKQILESKIPSQTSVDQ